MRNWIDLLESLIHFDGEDAIGYWYNPRSGKSYTIAWEASEGIPDTYEDHADVVWEHPDWFGLPEGYLEGDDVDMDTARYGAVLMGWVRVGYNRKSGLRMDARNPSEAFKTMKWFVSKHSEETIVSINIDLVSEDAITSYRIERNDVIEYESNGRLSAAWRTGR